MSTVRFVILSTQRTGSTWLCDTLSSHSRVFAYTELFLPTGEGVPTWSQEKDVLYWKTWHKQQSGMAKLFRPGAVYRYLNELYAQHPSAAATGFKLMYSQAMRTPEVMAYLYSKKVRVIHLIRSNFLDVVVSEEILKKTGFAHSRETVDKPRIEIDTDFLIARLKRKSRNLSMAKRVVSTMGLPVVEIEYEDMVADKDALLPIWKFLGVQVEETTSSLRKRGARKLSDTLINYDAVAAALRNTPYAFMLH